MSSLLCQTKFRTPQNSSVGSHYWHLIFINTSDRQIVRILFINISLYEMIFRMIIYRFNFKMLFILFSRVLWGITWPPYDVTLTPFDIKLPPYYLTSLWRPVTSLWHHLTFLWCQITFRWRRWELRSLSGSTPPRGSWPPSAGSREGSTTVLGRGSADSSVSFTEKASDPRGEKEKNKERK